MLEPATLPIHCAYCGGAITLQMADWPSSVTPDTPSDSKEWPCPYCQRMNTGGMPGRLVWVTKGHEPEKPEPQ